MKINAVTILAALLPCSIYGENPSECLESVEEGKDYFPDKVEPLSSEFWDITYHNTYKIIKNEISAKSYLLYQCGTEPPAEELDGRHDAVVQVPVQDGVAITQVVAIPHLELLDVRTQIKGYFGNPEYIASPCVNKMIDDGEIMVVQNSTNADDVNALLDFAGPDLVTFTGSFDEAIPLDNKIVIEAYKETSNAAVYEWNKVYAAFFNLEALANQEYDDITERYECVDQNANIISADGPKPTVLWAHYDTYGNGWDVAKCPNYYCEYAETCSANLLTSREGSIEGWEGKPLMTIGEFVEFGKDADVWFYIADNWQEYYEANKEQLDTFKSVQNKMVYDNQGTFDTWYENRFVEYDTVAQDFCEIVGSRPQDPIHNKVFLRNVFNEEIKQLPECTDVNAPLETGATECTILDPGTQPTPSGANVAHVGPILPLAAVICAFASLLL